MNDGCEVVGYFSVQGAVALPMPKQALLLRYVTMELPSDNFPNFPMFPSILLVFVELVMVKLVKFRFREVSLEQP